MTTANHNPRETLLAGKDHDAGMGDFRWVMQQPGGNNTVRLFSYVLRKIFRHSLKQVTFDAESFKSAVAAVPANTPIVVIPVHRSYYDFLFCSYLFYAHPELGISLPKIAAAEEFGQVPILGRLLNQAGAFYIRRGQGKEDMQLTEQVHELVQNRETFEFFIEGKRSRSREFLQPKRGLLRCLQGELDDKLESFAILPIAITYDRLPEERAMLQELSGGPKSRMTIPAMSAWAVRLFRGNIRLGRIHIRCAEPLSLNRKTDIPTLSNDVMAALQSNTFTTDFHHAAFVSANPQLALTAEQFKSMLKARGGKTLHSELPANDATQPIPPTIERSLRYHWIQLFCAEARLLQPGNPALTHYCSRHNYLLSQPKGIALNGQTIGVLTALFAPVLADYQRLALVLKSALSDSNLSTVSIKPDDLLARTLKQYPQSDLTTLQCAIDGLTQAGLLQKKSTAGPCVITATTKQLDDYIATIAWQPQTRHATTQANRK